MRDKVYKKEDELKMIERFKTLNWVYDDKEFDSFKEALVLADTTARGCATNIEGGMVVTLIELEMYDKIEPDWVIEHHEQLEYAFGRSTMLYVLQTVMMSKNKLGYTYVEDIEILRMMWDSYKK